ncbi:hypothetical protein BDN71DRAFT_1590785 [Pleurotus eryngii]|uniref:Zn(2)-C6 fungal-type domain-containing protein n=1 Tax=Pleurotus eryngii TaxID=5323 RepID=A0A9P5ZUN8_PLEER|nr:hypothetical protein BDN71DRAFT_1590785 [Pleurotus eryngii]
MPVDPSTKSKLKRRSSRRDIDEFKFDGTHARELEIKRNRGAVSCAECRRLKIKCDKQIPCQSCQRRGCAALCPNGSLATGQGTRFVLAATEHLHRRISRLRDRVRQLEDALAALQAKQSSEPHPLLREDLLSTGGDDAEDSLGIPEDGGAPTTGMSNDALDAFGTLSISDHGISRFFGPTGGSESLLMGSTDTSPASSHSPASVQRTGSPLTSAPLDLFSRSFPFTPLGPVGDVRILIEEKLPTWTRAISLCNTYFEQAGWLFHGVTKEQVYEDMLPAIYRQKSATSSPSSSFSYPGSEEYTGPHDLALLFIMLAVGALVESDPKAEEAEHLHQISMAALGLQSVLEKPSIVTVQALHLMSIYNAMSGSDLTSDTSMEMTWSLIYLAAHLSQSIGLHRDSARWGLSPKMVQRRRILFWDLFVADSWTSLNTGRPPSFSLAYIDCEFPDYKDGLGESGGDINTSFESWGFRFAAECVADVASRTLTAEAPSYATIMELDKKVRDFSLPPLPVSSSGDQRESFAAEFTRCVLDHTRETILLYIHRSFFAQAIIDQPINPLKSAYAYSFLAAYRASSTILKSVKEQFRTWPAASACFWSMWTFAFSAAVVFGTVVTRGPRSPLASSAMAELEQACILFSKAAQYSNRARKALPILTRLSEKARLALAAAQCEEAGTGAGSESGGGLLWSIKQEDTGDDELDIFAGRTRFVSAKQPSVALAPSNGSSWPKRYQDSGQPVYAHDPHTLLIHPPFTRHPNQSRNHPQGHLHQPQHSGELQQLTQNPATLGYTPETVRPMLEPWAPERRHSDVYSHATASVPIARSRLGTTQFQNLSVDQYPPQETRSVFMESPSDPYPWPDAPHKQYSSSAGPHYNQGQYPGAHSHQHGYTTTPAFHGTNIHPAHPELAALGLAARDSRLDARWSAFMQDSGLLEDPSKING